MSAQYRDNLNNPYQRTLYSTARARQNCVSCPSSCSCDLGQRSNMDRLMIQAWQEGPEGHTSVFDTLNTNHHKPNHSMHHSEPKAQMGLKMLLGSSWRHVGTCWEPNGVPSSTPVSARRLKATGPQVHIAMHQMGRELMMSFNAHL